MWVLGYKKKVLEREGRKIVLMHYPPAEGYHQSSEMLVCFSRGGELPG
jgi:calcineurin-like phosphoesterase family protein